MKFKSGFVSVIGRPNVGKSTTINNIMKEKISITSDKPQTTRNIIKAIYTDKESQIVFIDTPGIHKPKNKLGEVMTSSALNSTHDSDITLMLVDNSLEIGVGDTKIIETLRNRKGIKILAINKIDKLAQEQVIKLLDSYSNLDVFDEIIPMSAMTGFNIDTLIKVIKNYLSEGPQYFPENMITDQPERALAAEIIREKVLNYTEQEVPHGVAVEIEKMKIRKEKQLMDISAVIYCERSSHKGIIIGKSGRKLKGIGKSAREELEHLLSMQVNLQIWVKIKENWRDQDFYIKNFGFKED